LPPETNPLRTEGKKALDPQRISRLRPRSGVLAPLWVMTYADLMSLLLVLFVFLYSSRVTVERAEPVESPSPRVAGRPEWVYLGTLPSMESSVKEIAERLRGSRSRVALVGFDEKHEEAFGAACKMRDLLVTQEIEASRFLLVSGGRRKAPSALPLVDVYSRE